MRMFAGAHINTDGTQKLKGAFRTEGGETIAEGPQEDLAGADDSTANQPEEQPPAETPSADAPASDAS